LLRPINTKGPAPLKRTAIAIALLFVFDLFVMGQGIFSLMVSFLGVTLLLVGAVWAYIRGRRELSINRLYRASMYVALAIATFGMLNVHAWTAEKRADQVIAACRSYKAKNGKFPDRLQDLVPDFLPSIPPAKYTLTSGDFQYFTETDGVHMLMYVAVPPFGRRLYTFETGR
jgi:hypothetical protein